MGSFSLTHLLILAIVLLILFGPNRLPQLGRGVGRAIRGFKDGLAGKESSDEETAPPPRSVGSNAPERLETPRTQDPSSESTTPSKNESRRRE